jgi:uncharacterized protein YjiS (DUF1127 family)
MSTQDLYLHLAEAPGRAVQGIESIFRAFLRRRKVSRLQDLDDHILDDIGLTRRDVEIATRLPFSRDAADELRRLALEHRRDREAVLRARYRV